MPQFEHDQIVPFQGSELNKKQQVSDMFNRIAYRYDFLNHFLSGGADIWWRKRAIRELRALKGANILDVATGTADMAIMMAKELSANQITGIDISEGMLEIGRNKILHLGLEKKISLQTGDSEAMEFPDASFDAITVAFGVRNFENLMRGLLEMRRVLKPGGKLIILEFSKPKAGTFKQLYRFYLGVIAPAVVQLFSKRQAYEYLNKTVQSFPEGASLLAAS